MDATEQIIRCAKHQQADPLPPPAGWQREEAPETMLGAAVVLVVVVVAAWAVVYILGWS